MLTVMPSPLGSVPMLRHNAPTPDLRILPVARLHAHELHDTQRSEPLIARLREDTAIINPPLVAPMDGNDYVVLDGANRVHGFAALGYPHIIAQVADYESGYLQLETWQHVISEWNATTLLDQWASLAEIALHEGQHAHALAHVQLNDGRLLALQTPIETAHARNAALCNVVSVYQSQARLHRTALTEPHEVWQMFPTAVALITFQTYQPADIIAAARERAYLPPGVSRHIMHGRALRVNYPLAVLRDESQSLEAKNAELRVWLQSKLANRQVRYYAEATYQFDE